MEAASASNSASLEYWVLTEKTLIQIWKYEFYLFSFNCEPSSIVVCQLIEDKLHAIKNLPTVSYFKEEKTAINPLFGPKTRKILKPFTHHTWITLVTILSVALTTKQSQKLINNIFLCSSMAVMKQLRYFLEVRTHDTMVKYAPFRKYF